MNSFIQGVAQEANRVISEDEKLLLDQLAKKKKELATLLNYQKQLERALAQLGQQLAQDQQLTNDAREHINRVKIPPSQTEKTLGKTAETVARALGMGGVKR